MNALVVGTFGAIAAVRQFPGWQVSEEDALSISRPLNTVLKKYPSLAEKVMDASAPVALVTAMVWITGPRVVADRMYQAAMQEQARIAARERAVVQGAAQPQHVGAVNVPPTVPDSSDAAAGTGFPKFVMVDEPLHA